MDPILLASIVNGMFTLAEAKVERGTVIDRLQGIPPEKYPDILDSMFAEAKAARDQAIRDAP